jgi:catechol 2,3-dioxygenase-like lactoylglutathione lyase family enzyme
MRQNPYGDHRQRFEPRHDQQGRSTKGRVGIFTSHPTALKVARSLAYESFERFQASAKTISFLIAGALRDPSDPAFRRLRAGNAALWERLGPSGFKIIEDCGYSRCLDDGEVFYVLDHVDERALREIEVVLDMAIMYGQQWLRTQLVPYDHAPDIRFSEQYGSIRPQESREEWASKRTAPPTGERPASPPREAAGVSPDIELSGVPTYSNLIKDCREKFASILVGDFLQDIRTFLCNVLGMRVLRQEKRALEGIDEWEVGVECLLGYEDGHACLELVEGSHTHRETDTSSAEYSPKSSVIDTHQIGIQSDEILRETLNRGHCRGTDGSVRLMGPGHTIFRIVQSSSAEARRESDRRIGVMAIFYAADINKSLRFWRNLLGLRVQKGSIFGDSNAVFIFANDEDSKPSIILHKAKEALSTTSRTNKYQFTFICPLSQIQLLSLLAAREGHMILRPLSSAVQVRMASLILLSPDGNRVRFIPSEHAQLNRTERATPAIISEDIAPRQEPPGVKAVQPVIPTRQPLTALIRMQLLSLSRLLSRINADEAAEDSESSLSLDFYRDSVLQTCNSVDSLFARICKAGAQGFKVEREESSTFKTAEKHLLESCASCLPDLEQLRDEGKLLLASLAETRRESLQKDRALSDLQAATSKAEASAVRHKTDLLSAEERVLQCSALSDAIAEEMTLARQEMQVREERRLLVVD